MVRFYYRTEYRWLTEDEIRKHKRIIRICIFVIVVAVVILLSLDETRSDPISYTLGPIFTFSNEEHQEMFTWGVIIALIAAVIALINSSIAATTKQSRTKYMISRKQYEEGMRKQRTVFDEEEEWERRRLRALGIDHLPLLNFDRTRQPEQKEERTQQDRQISQKAKLPERGEERTQQDRQISQKAELPERGKDMLNYCPSCRCSVSPPSFNRSPSGYARFYRGVCPNCATPLVFRKAKDNARKHGT